MIPNKKTARLAGFLWLMVIVLGLFAQVGVRERILVPGDAVATVNAIASNAFLFRLGFVSDLAMLLCYLLTSFAFYKLFASVNKNLSMLIILFCLAGTTIGMLNLLNEFAALHISSGIEYMGVFDARQQQAQAMLYLDLYEHGYVIAQIFFSLWVFPLGVLIYRSGFFPKAFSILFVIESITGLFSIIIHFLMPNVALESGLLWLGAIAEFSFTFWLLIRGMNEAKVNMGIPASIRA